MDATATLDFTAVALQELRSVCSKNTNLPHSDLTLISLDLEHTTVGHS